MRFLNYLTVIILLISVTAIGSAATRHVPGQYPTIQAGIDAANNGDTVLIADGTYSDPGNFDLALRDKTLDVRSANGPEGCIIDPTRLGRGFYIYREDGDGSKIAGFTFRNCDGLGSHQGRGAGIFVQKTELLITNCVFLDGSAQKGGGIYIINSDDSQITNCIFRENNVLTSGGGVYTQDGDVNIINCLFIANHAGSKGGGLKYYRGSTNVVNCTFTENEAENEGSAVHLNGTALTITNSILWNNVGDEIGGNDPVVTYSDVQGGFAGTGNISVDPRWVAGLLGSQYLSHTAAGQAVNSPCINKGNVSATNISFPTFLQNGTYTDTKRLSTMTTRTDHVDDYNIVDLGFHYEWVKDPGPTGDPTNNWYHIVTGPGPGPLNPPLVKTSLAQWYAYGVMKYGVNVASGDLNGDGGAEVITGPGPGRMFGPHVRVWNPDGTPFYNVNRMAYGTHKYGVNVAAGDIDGDGYDEIVTGPGPGAVFGPHLRGWNVDTGNSMSPIGGVSFLAYGTNRWGVTVACGDIDGDGYDEIITGAGPGRQFGPHVRGWNYDGTGGTQPMNRVNFFAGNTTQFGVNVACGDVDGDGYDEIITGPGPGESFAARFRVYNYDGNSISQRASQVAYNSANYGVVVGAADVNNDGKDEILTMPGPNPNVRALVKVWKLNGSQLVKIKEFYAYGTSVKYGGKIAGGPLD